jgi:methyltransferase (TIGR00027 family)
MAVGRFNDPVAMALLREDERVPVRQVREGTAPSGWSERTAFETVRASAEVMVPRTVAIDDAVRDRVSPQVVILGAGLDARAWRMPVLSTVDIFEVDHPASQADKRSRVDGLPQTTRSVRFVPVDFAQDRLDQALRAAGHRSDVPTTWVWEGVIPYLRRADVAATVQMVGSLSAAGSRLVANYQVPSMLTRVGRRISRAVAGQHSPLAGEPWRSLWRPAQIDKLFRSHGFSVVTDRTLVDIAHDLGMPIHSARSLASGRVTIADQAS